MPTLHASGGDFAYTDAGTGEAVILLHAAGGNRRQWRALIERLAGRYRVFAPDLGGHGDTGPWPAGPSRLGDYAPVINALIGLAGAHRAHLVGHSHGGAIAGIHALDQPQTVTTLTLIEPMLTHLLGQSDERAAWKEAHSQATLHQEAVAAGRLDETAEAFIPYWTGRAAWKSMPSDRKAAIVRSMPGIAEFWRAQFAETQPLSAFAAMVPPALLLSGAATPAPARAIIRLLQGAMPSATVVEVPGAGHMVPLTHGDAVNAAIEAHLARAGV